MAQNSICPDCGSTKLKLIGKLPDSNEFSGNITTETLAGGNLYLCNNCRLKFRFPILEETVYNELYNTENSNWVFDEYRNDWRILNEFIKKNVPGNGKILDFGCNLGDVLCRLPDETEKFGIEINDRAAEVAREKSKATVWKGFDEIPDNLKFDLIFAIDVIEHLSSPRGFIQQTIPHLKKGGFIALLSGDSNNYFWKLSGVKWWYTTFPEHIAFISKLWATKLCENVANLEVVYSKNYTSTKKPVSKQFKWFLTWVVNFVFQNRSQYLFKLLPKLKKSGMGEKKHFGRNFSADHLLIVFRKTGD
jgi:SAM-dependent methyltransferase